MLKRLFRLSENHTTARTETLAGLTTFLTMAYIIFVQPASSRARCSANPQGWISAQSPPPPASPPPWPQPSWPFMPAIPSPRPPEWAKISSSSSPPLPPQRLLAFPIPGPPPSARSSSPLFLILSLVGLRELIFNAVSPSLKNGIATGIGLFIAFIGLQNAGLIIKDPGTAVKMNAHFASPDLLVFFAGPLLTAVLHARKIRGSILWGILGATTLALLLKLALGSPSPIGWERG